MAIAPLRGKAISPDRVHLLQLGLLLREHGVGAHIPFIRAFPGAVGARAGVPERVEGVLRHLAVVPGDLEDLALGEDPPAGGPVEDVGHHTDDRDAMATLDDFEKIEMRVGRVVAVDDFPAARNPSYKLTIDFGPCGTRRSADAVPPRYSNGTLPGPLRVGVPAVAT